MAPMNWLIMFILFLMIFIMFNMLNYFLTINMPKPLKMNKILSSYNWKW